MRVHNIFFYSVLFFLIGVFIAGFKINFAIVVLSSFLTVAIFLFFYFLKHAADDKMLWISVLSFFIIIGAFYYKWHNTEQIQNLNIPFDEKTAFNGIVVDYPQRGNRQQLTIELQPPYSGKIITNLKPYPSFDYGDLIEFEGIIKKPEPRDYADYLAKDGVFGVVNYPKTEFISENQASNFKARLFRLKDEIVAIFQKTLSPEKSALLSGITIGERAEFSKELKDAMAKSGTTHIVALSGYNITIIAGAALAFFSLFLGRKSSFIPAVLVIIAFVLMTGAEASVVRAAIMGGIVLLAKRIGRVHSMRNAIAAAALLMILYNPKVLNFDIGFQLSFAALIGIVYIFPFIKKVLKLKEESGFLAWRENLLTTVSAQFAVLPLIIFYFGNFSIFAVAANVLILTAIPITMFIGFIMAGSGFVYMPLAVILGWFVDLLLSYELVIIRVFSKFF